MKRKWFYYIFYCFDACLVILLLPFWLVLFVVFKGRRIMRKNSAEQPSLLHISSSSSIGQVLKKFGSLEFLFNYDGNATEGVFKRNIMFWFAAEETMRKDFQNNWIVIQQQSTSGLFPVLNYLYSIAKIINISIRYNVQAVRGWGPYQPGFMAWVTAAVLGSPFCVSIHADYHKRDQLQGEVIPHYWGSIWLAEKLERIVYRQADIVCPIRESLIPGLLKQGIKADKIRIFPHGIDLSKFRQTEKSGSLLDKYGLDKNKKLLSVVGRLVKDNYIYDYIDIAKQLRQLRSDWIMCIAGDGKEREELQRKIKQYDLIDHVLLLGFLPQEEIIALRNSSAVNICLMAGFSLLEACASARPVITYDVEWHYEVIINDTSGVIVPEHDLSQAVKAIAFLFDHPEKADSLGATARNIVYEKFDTVKNSAIKKKVYQELLAMQ